MFRPFQTGIRSSLPLLFVESQLPYRLTLSQPHAPLRLPVLTRLTSSNETKTSGATRTRTWIFSFSDLPTPNTEAAPALTLSQSWPAFGKRPWPPPRQLQFVLRKAYTRVLSH